MRSDLLCLILAGAAVILSSCAPVDPGLGEALKYNQAIQTINPDPVYPADSAQPGAAGTAAAAAAQRYRLGTVKPVEAVTISSGSAGPK